MGSIIGSCWSHLVVPSRRISIRIGSCDEVLMLGVNWVRTFVRHVLLDLAGQRKTWSLVSLSESQAGQEWGW